MCAVSLRDIVTVCSRDLIVVHFRVVSLCLLVYMGLLWWFGVFVWNWFHFYGFYSYWVHLLKILWVWFFHFVNLLELLWVCLHDRHPWRYFMVGYLCCFWILSMMGWWFCSISVSTTLVVLALRVALSNILSISLRSSLWESPSVTIGLVGAVLRRHELSPVLNEWLSADFWGKKSTV